MAEPLDQLLAPLDADILRQLLLAAAAGEPQVEKSIRHQLTLLQLQAAAKSPASRSGLPPVNLDAVREALRMQLGGYRRRAYEYIGSSGFASAAWEALQEADARSVAGDAAGALAILETVTEAFTDAFEAVDDSDGNLGLVGADLAASWTRALLAGDLSKTERAKWANKIENWAREATGYGVDDLQVAEHVARSGWDAVEAACEEVQTQAPRSIYSRDSSAHTVVSAAIAALRSNAPEQGLALALRAKRHGDAAEILVELSRLAEAIDIARTHFTSGADALSLAEKLHARGATAEALEVAEIGLDREESARRLAEWTKDAASSAGRTELALRAAQAHVRATGDISSYLQLPALAGHEHERVRKDLLAHMARAPRSEYVGIFLHEGRVDDAIAALGDYAYYDVVEKVARAAVTARPEWVIAECRRQAESIMDRGKADHYDRAAVWLFIARDAYHAAGKVAEWKEYLAGLLATHGRKYKLVPLLEKLR